MIKKNQVEINDNDELIGIDDYKEMSEEISLLI